MLSFRKKLNQLTEFNQAIVYCLEPERMTDPSNGLRTIAQHSDVLDAYLYLQDLLPALRDHLAEQLTPDYLLNVISNIHERVANTLMQFDASKGKAKAGQYTPTPVMRWQAGIELKDIMATYFSVGYSPAFMHIKKLALQQMTQFAEKQGVSRDTITALLKMLLKIEKNPENYPFPVEQERFVREKGNDGKEVALAGSILYLRLVYNMHQFTAEEKHKIAPVLLVPVTPDKIKDAMQAFAERTCSAWKSVDRCDLEAVKEFQATVFYELTSIHPYSNGNGRTATALMNLIFRTLGYPSILMRFPGDKGNKDSSYTKAMMQIEEDRAPLVAHLGVQLAGAGFSDEVKRDVCCLRFKLMKDIDSMSEQYPGIQPYLSRIMNKMTEMYLEKYPAPQEIDAIRFVGNVFHSFVTGREDKKINNPKYQPSLFKDKAIEIEQEGLKHVVINKIKNQFLDRVSSRKPLHC